jgi:putative SOS response-associated peptidase YedK
MQSNLWKPWLLRAEHRCLVPFTRFAEPKAVADRQGPGDTNWWFTVEDQSVPCFAGLWKVDQDHDRVYAFCTTEPNPLVAPKHPKAMPVILMAEDQERWLTASVEEAVTLLTAYPSQLMGVG